ncbi:MAG: ferritin family protein [Candidatus Hydrothermarchaeales archaeon]
MAEEEALEALKEDLKLELGLISLYERYIEEIGDRKIKKTLMHMVEDSTKHALALRRLIHKILLDKEAGEGLSKERILEILERGLEEEENAVEVYEGHLRVIDDREVLDRVMEICADENEHEEEIKRAIEYLLAKG